MATSTSLGAKLLHNLGSAVAGTLSTTLLGIVTFSTLARALGPHGLGQYRTVLTLVLFAGMFVDFGLTSISLREMSRPNTDRGRVLGSAMALRICGLFCAILVLSLIADLAGYDMTITGGVLVAGAGWIGYQSNDLLRSVFQLTLSQHLGAIGEVAGALVTLALVVSLAALGGGTDEMIAATAAGYAATAGLAWFFARRLMRFRPRIDFQMWRQLVKAGLPVAGSTILLTLQWRMDIMLLAIMRSPTDVGHYDVAAKLYEFAALTPYLAGGLLMPQFVRDLHSAGASLVPRLNAAVGVAFIFAVLMFSVLWAEAEPLVVLLGGSDFVASATPLRILGAAAGLAGVSWILRFAATAIDQPAKMLRADICGVVTSAVVGVLLIPNFGLIGAAVGKLSGDLSRLVVATVLLRNYLDKQTCITAGVSVVAGAALSVFLVLAGDCGVNWLIASAIGCGAVCGALLLVPRVRRDLAAVAAH